MKVVHPLHTRDVVRCSEGKDVFPFLQPAAPRHLGWAPLEVLPIDLRRPKGHPEIPGTPCCGA